MLSSGIPTREAYERLESEILYPDLLKYSQEFEQRSWSEDGSVRRYRNKWVKDPFRQWSRRWEYVYVAQRLLQWAENQPTGCTVVDAGSGFTFFPFYLSQVDSGIEMHCYDSDPTVGEALLEACDILGAGPEFSLEDLESLGQDDETIDAVYSVSVIEHTKNPRKVIDEVYRILKPGGLFICTFDISFETRSPMYVGHVRELIEHIAALFDFSSDWKPISFDSLPLDNDIVTTKWDSDTIRSGLPWRNPLLVWFYDVLRGRYRNTLYRPMTFCCQSMSKKRILNEQQGGRPSISID